MSAIDAIMKRLLTLHPKLIDLELTRLTRLLDRLGRPQDGIKGVIHVAGTNGKGSTIAFLRAMLEAAGRRVNVYTSPHLVAFHERIRLGGRLVDNAALLAALEECEAANGGEPITYFEITTAAAFLLFARDPADHLLLEVGLGGEFDATNVVARPAGTIITPISRDHTQFLGETLAEIAKAKAGILKRGAPAVVSRQPEEAMAVIEKTAARLGVVPFAAGADFDGFVQRGRFVFQDDSGLLDLPLPALIGAHQIGNAAVAVAAVRHFGLPVPEAAIAAGLRQAVWPGRLMPLRGALAAFLSQGQELWLDGGHNEAGALVLSEALREMDRTRPAPLVLVVGMMSTKDAAGYFVPFGDFASSVLTVPIPGEANALDPVLLAEAAHRGGLVAEPSATLAEALRKAARVPGARIVICGSLYLAGHALAENGTPPD